MQPKEWLTRWRLRGSGPEIPEDMMWTLPLEAFYTGAPSICVSSPQVLRWCGDYYVLANESVFLGIAGSYSVSEGRLFEVGFRAAERVSFDPLGIRPAFSPTGDSVDQHRQFLLWEDAKKAVLRALDHGALVRA